MSKETCVDAKRPIKRDPCLPNETYEIEMRSFEKWSMSEMSKETYIDAKRPEQENVI